MAVSYEPSGSTLGASVWNDVTELAPGSPGENWSDEGGIAASVQLKVPWASRWDIVDDVVNLGLTYPYLPGSYLFVRSVGIKPWNSAATKNAPHGIDYQHAVLTLNFSPLDYDSGTSSVYAESIEPNAEFLVLDYQDFQWGTGGSAEALKPQEAPGKLIHGFDYVQTRYGLATLPTNLLTAAGTVNGVNHTAGVIGLTFPAETLLFNDPSTERTINSDGSGKWMLKTKLSYRSATWNKFWRAKTQSWETMYLAGTTTPYKNFPLDVSNWSGIVI